MAWERAGDVASATESDYILASAPSLKFILPCNPATARTVPASDAWLRLYSRRGNEWTGRVPALADALAGIPC